MRISDWSSDVCSSDLVIESLVDGARLLRQGVSPAVAGPAGSAAAPVKAAARADSSRPSHAVRFASGRSQRALLGARLRDNFHLEKFAVLARAEAALGAGVATGTSEERRVGKES